MLLFETTESKPVKLGPAVQWFLPQRWLFSFMLSGEHFTSSSRKWTTVLVKQNVTLSMHQLHHLFVILKTQQLTYLLV